MASNILLSDGTQIEVLDVISGFDLIRGNEREVIEILMDGDKISYNMIKDIYSQSEKLSSIIFNKELEDGTSEFIEFLDFNIPDKISSYERDGFFIITLKLGRKSFIEQQQEKLMKDNLDIQLALAELAVAQASIETQLGKGEE